MGATPSMTGATPETPALFPVQGRQSNPPPHWPPRPHKRGARRIGRPPTPTPPPGAGTPGTRRPTPRGARNPKQGWGEMGPGRPPQRHARQSKGPGQDTRRGMDRVERPYRRPAPGAHEVRAPHRPGEGRGGSGRRGSASAHTHNGHAGNTRRAIGPSAQNTQTAYEQARVRDPRTGRPATHSAGHAGREGGNGGEHNTRYRPGPPKPAASAAHTRTGHCTRQDRSGALRHAPTRRLGSSRATPSGSHWQQASSKGPAAPASRATTH